ncbi:MAG TPA: FG-GAP-like repeat-containing protein, partial [Armatimonadota bacterium]|nr:FG-GAP-like repeat-containing protein [Armatimonadota bacterium]
MTDLPAVLFPHLLMRPLPLLLTLAAGCLLLTGCPAPKPWQGVNAREYASLNEHRILGIAYQENDGQAGEALKEFEAIRRAQPGLAFGYVNEAVSLLKMSNRLQNAREAAQTGVERSPRLAWPLVVLARVHQAAGQAEKATPLLEKAAQLAPRDLRVLGALAKQLDSLPGEKPPRLHDLYGQIAELAPRNLAAQANWLLAQAERGELDGLRATFQRLTELIPRIPANLQEPAKALQQAIESRSPETGRAARVFVNVLKSNPLYNPSQNEIYGNDRDPADMVMREWDVPPPPLPEPPLKDVTVTWKDVTAGAGLSGITVSGVTPVATGDLDLAPDAGVQRDKGLTPVLGRPDLVLGPAATDVWINNGQAFAHSPSALFPNPGQAGASVSPLLADFNNDFTLDLYVADASGDRLWLNPRSGSKGGSGITFALTTAKQQPVGIPGARGPGSAMVVDLDQDGDLDVIRTSSAPDQPAIRYLRNNGNLTFTDLTAQTKLTTPSQGARQTVFGDFNDDGAPDLFIARAGGPSQLILNRRQDVFRNASAEWGIKPEAGAMSAAVADFDRDDDWDLIVAGHAPHGTLVYRNEGSKFAPDAEALSALGGGDWDWVQALDYDNDTWIDLVFAGKGGVRLLRNDRGKFVDGGSAFSEPATWVKALDYDTDGDPDLLVATADGKVHLLSNEGGNGRPWLRAELEGYLLPSSQSNGKPNSDTQANNSYAIGATLEPRTAWDTQKILVTEPQTHVGLGRADRALTLRVTWTHNIPQNRIEPQTGQVVHYTQTPTGSCPFLYTWDGEKWEFACDFNWRSPLGMLFARGVPVPHDQTLDWVKLPAERMRPSGDFYPLIATEELREVSYFDMIRLLAVDHPAETEIYVDERFKMGPPDPFRIYTATERRLPVSARNDAGEDLLPMLKAVDRVYTPVPAGPYRGVRAPHDLVLDLGSVPDPRNVKLFLNGWIYPAGTSTNVATGQNPELKIIPPTLYVGDGKGGWALADDNVGLPCGKRKTIVLDLSNRFRGSDFRVKLTTTMEIRWDAAFFTSGDREVVVRQAELPLAEAELRERGYGTRYREVEDGPDLFDYNRPLPPGEPGWPDLQGAFTKLGDCAPLLRKVDDQYAIIAPGDEIRMLFDARKLPPLPA